MVLRAFLVWLIIILAESLNGTFRELFLKQWVGDLSARRISFPIALVLIYTITFICIRWIGVSGRKGLLAIGVSWVALTFCFEAVVARQVMKIAWDKFLQEYNIFEGGMMPIGLLLLALAPLIVDKIRSEYSNLSIFRNHISDRDQ